MTWRLLLPLAGLILGAGANASLVRPAAAAVPALKLAPLQYRTHLELGAPQTGILDVSNPTGAPVKLQTEVQGFRQTDNDGTLEYYDDERLRAAITPSLGAFTLGPREAVRLSFVVDPNKLGPGGSYGVIFVRTLPSGPAPAQLGTSARIGTLLIMDVAGTGQRQGTVGLTALPAWHYGSAPIRVQLTYHNTGTARTALAFAPQLELSLDHQPAAVVPDPFVFPGRTRTVATSFKPGNRIGLVTVRVGDTSGGSSPVTRRIWLVSGYWTWLLPLLIIIGLGVVIGYWRSRRVNYDIEYKHSAWAQILAWWRLKGR